jgi:Protein of unknown function (DUF3592)
MWNRSWWGILVVVALAGWSHPASADSMIEAQLRPYFVGGGALAGILFAALAYVCLREGARRRSRADAIAASSPAAGTVLESSVFARVDRGGEGGTNVWYIPRVRYAYQVAGVAYEGDVVQVGLAEFGHRTEQHALAHVARYPVGAAVSVYCDPDDPRIAALETGQVGAGGKTFAGILLSLVALMAVAFAVWCATLRTY